MSDDYYADCFATPANASDTRIALALKAVEGLATSLLLEVVGQGFIIECTAAKHTLKRLGIESDKILFTEESGK